MNIIDYKSLSPKIDNTAYISDGVYLIGDVKVASHANIWFGSVVRGDVAPVTIGKNTNIQDGTIIHTSRNDGPTIIGDNVTIGHKAMIHACTIQDLSFIGMSATIMDKAVIEPYGFVAAGALISPGKVVKSKELWAGCPAKFMRYLSDQEIEDIKKSAENYVKLGQEYKHSRGN